MLERPVFLDFAQNRTDLIGRKRLGDEIEGTVHRTIQQLPEDLRTALTLRGFDGLSYEDIAAVMQCPVGTVRSRIFRAREAIDKALQPLLQEN